MDPKEISEVEGRIETLKGLKRRMCECYRRGKCRSCVMWKKDLCHKYHGLRDARLEIKHRAVYEGVFDIVSPDALVAELKRGRAWRRVRDRGHHIRMQKLWGIVKKSRR